jgi:uncharacterized membrane protein
VAPLTRYRPAALGVGTFLLTLPFLFGGGSGDGDIPIFRSYGDRVLNGDVPYRDFHPEYPPGAFIFFVLPSLGPERRYLLIFQLIAAVGIVLGLVLLALLVERLGATRRLQYFALFFAGISPLLLGAFTLRRFDMWPAALCVGVLLLLIDDRPEWALSVLAVATVIKSYPVILLPIALLAVDRRRRWRSLAAFCGVGFLLALPFAVLGHGGLYNSVATQADRHLHLDSIGSSLLLVLHRPVRLAFDGGGWSVFGGGADAVAKIQTAAQFAGIALSAVLFARSRREPWDLVCAAAATLTVGACFGKILSPQFLLWIVPLVVLARSALAVALFAAAMITTHVLFPDRYSGLLAKHDAEIWLLVARNVLLVALVVVLLRVQVRRVATVATSMSAAVAHG